MAIGTNGTYWQNRVGSGAMNTKPSESLGFPLVHPPIGTIGTNGTGDFAKNDPSEAVAGAAGTTAAHFLRVPVGTLPASLKAAFRNEPPSRNSTADWTARRRSGWRGTR